MKVTRNKHGFEHIEFPANLSSFILNRLVQQSLDKGSVSAADGPGKTHLWIGPHWLSREQVAELMQHLHCWLASGSLEVKP